MVYTVVLLSLFPLPRPSLRFCFPSSVIEYLTFGVKHLSNWIMELSSLKAAPQSHVKWKPFKAKGLGILGFHHGPCRHICESKGPSIFGLRGVRFTLLLSQLSQARFGMFEMNKPLAHHLGFQLWRPPLEPLPFPSLQPPYLNVFKYRWFSRRWMDKRQPMIVHTCFGIACMGWEVGASGT